MKKEEILAKALEMFNEKGIEYVGMREIATAMGTRVGNITYYFPKKADIILGLSGQLRATNAAILKKAWDDKFALCDLFEFYRCMFHNQLEYRCLMLSFVHLISRYPVLTEHYRGIESLRQGQNEAMLEQLQRNHELRPKLRAEDKKALLSLLSLIGRFWVSEAYISFKNKTGEEKIAHYLKTLAQLFSLYATPKGRKGLQEFLGG